ncbi:MAG: hypothetical protein M1361_00570 [Patescibacteria group bacterium]|nr:hypothetical protein [Patescibacteria group bacterium]MCL5224105.1 hypothetical protein [Patescibacteria group bacterium]
MKQIGDTKTSLSEGYVRGLIDGEGYFAFSTSPGGRRSVNGRVVTYKFRIPEFAIGMHERDANLIKGVRDTMGLSSVVHIYKSFDKDGCKRGRRAFMCVRDIGQIKNIIVPFFYDRLVGYKGTQFNEWLEKIGNDPDVQRRFKLVYRLHKPGFYNKNPKF